ncbi:hypothetical protein LZ554_003198 [Drepanopeziza brunnea f. sp. 'monogermtubi']|nr:hypothetical protein LZ554_003198 [Drepanopeziza brunnea f. sp. 'monogermtubi']
MVKSKALIPIQQEAGTVPVDSQSSSIPPSIFFKPSNLLKASKSIARPFRKPASFPQFNRLPMELRFQIWEAAMKPRVHELHPCSKLYNERMTFRSNSSLTPSIFHVCSESRNIALQHHELMDYAPPDRGRTGKGILRFYFNPKLDTLLLNSLMGLFVMFMLLEDEEEFLGLTGLGVMKGWQRVAFDAERAQLITLLSGYAGHAPQPRFKAVFPALKELIIAFDCNSKGKTRFRTSVWPGENGTSLHTIPFPTDASGNEQPALSHARQTIMDVMIDPMQKHLENEFQADKTGVPSMVIAKVKRKPFLRGDLRYAFRKSCAVVGLKPRWVFRRL